MSSRNWWAVLLAVVVTTIGGFAVAGLQGGPGISDTGVYQRYGEQIAGGDLPYRDFAVEYPPGALVPFVLPALVTEESGGYDTAFRALMLIAFGAISVLLVVSLEALGASGRRILGSVTAFVAGIVTLGPFVLTRFDLYAAAFTLAAICAVLHGRDRLGSILLGVSIATKIYPAVLLPLLVTRIWRRDGRAAALGGSGSTAATALAIYLPSRSWHRRAWPAASGVRLGAPCRSRASGRPSCWRFTTRPECRSRGRPARAHRT